MALSGPPACPQEPAAKEGLFTVAPALVSAFMDRGVYMSGLSFQPTVAYTRGPFALELFGNFPVSGRIPGAPYPQIDVTASYSWDMAPDVLTVAPSVLLSTFPRADTGNGYYRAICELGVSFGFAPAAGLCAALDLWRDVVQKGGGCELGIEYSLPFNLHGAGAELSALMGRYGLSDTEANAPEKVRNRGNYFGAGVCFPFELSKKTKMTVGWSYAKGAHNHTQAGQGEVEPNPHAVGRGVFTFSFSRSFFVAPRTPKKTLEPFWSIQH